MEIYRAQRPVPVWQNVVTPVGNWFTNKDVLFGLLQYLFGQRDVSFVWPLTAISFVMTTLAAQFLLHERVEAVRWSGVALIMFGAAFISHSEHTKGKVQPADAAASASAATVTPGSLK